MFKNKDFFKILFRFEVYVKFWKILSLLINKKIDTIRICQKIKGSLTNFQFIYLHK